MIERQHNGNCVARALSTMRLALGYKESKPYDYEIGGKNTRWIAINAGDWFPDHKVMIYCGSASIPTPINQCKNVTYYPFEENNVFEEDHKFDNGITGFDYFEKNEDESNTVSHFVVGVPLIYKHMWTSIIVHVLFNDDTQK